MNSKGYRKLNHVIHIVAPTRVRSPRSARNAYYRLKLAEGKTDKEALRALKRRDLRRHIPPARRRTPKLSAVRVGKWDDS